MRRRVYLIISECMQHLHFWLVTAITCFLCTSVTVGCAGHPTRPDEFRLGQSFELRPGSSAILRDGLKVTFDEVRADSRCPMDALCVWAGDAIITVRLSQSAGRQAERALHTQGSGSEAQYLAYVIKLVALAPYPRSDRQIRPDDYVATLTVEDRSGQ
jgi:hypothetical protein